MGSPLGALYYQPVILGNKNGVTFELFFFKVIENGLIYINRENGKQYIVLQIK